MPTRLTATLLAQLIDHDQHTYLPVGGLVTDLQGEWPFWSFMFHVEQPYRRTRVLRCRSLSVPRLSTGCDAGNVGLHGLVTDRNPWRSDAEIGTPAGRNLAWSGAIRDGIAAHFIQCPIEVAMDAVSLLLMELSERLPVDADMNALWAHLNRPAALYARDVCHGSAKVGMLGAARVLEHVATLWVEDTITPKTDAEKAALT